ncbi:MAG TPA: HAD-IIB family hydrolase [Sphaerochaetaceae bacterium]|nr:HAD-IIB family hydrolase [Sphaerochaetaceae bacterium]
MEALERLTAEQASRIKYVLMDIDDTLTSHGKLQGEAYAALWRLHEQGLLAIPITGRPAGWCDLIARQWPVAAVVGENGALAFWEEHGSVTRLYHEQAVRNDHERLQKIQRRIMQDIPEARLATDQFSRLFDLAFDISEDLPHLTDEDAMHIQRICEEEGAIAKISSIHVNVWLGTYDKRTMASHVLSHRFGYDDLRDRDQVVYFGDSPNDEPMFSHFPMSIGVANIERYRSYMKRLPAFRTQSEGGIGFSEGIDRILALRG